MVAPKNWLTNCMPTMMRCNTAIWPNKLQLYHAKKKWVVIDRTTNNAVASFFLLASYSTLLVTINPWVLIAVEFLLCDPKAMVPKSMVAVQSFSSSKCIDRTIPQQVCRAYRKRVIPFSIFVPSLSTSLTISSLTNPSAASWAKNDHSDHDAVSLLVELSTAGSTISAGPNSSSTRKKWNNSKLTDWRRFVGPCPKLKNESKSEKDERQLQNGTQWGMYFIQHWGR